MRFVLLGVITVFLYTIGFSQTSEDAEIISQLKTIISAAATNYKSIQIGSGVLSGDDTVYSSSIYTKKTGSHTISHTPVSSVSNGYIYKIPVGTTILLGEDKALLKIWTARLEAALGPKYVKNCHDVDEEDYCMGEDCDYILKSNNSSITVTLSALYFFEDSTNQLDIYIRKK